MKCLQEKNKLNYNGTKDGEREKKAVLILLSYITLLTATSLSERDYWTDTEDLGVTIQKNVMTKKFLEKGADSKAILGRPVQRQKHLNLMCFPR